MKRWLMDKSGSIYHGKKRKQGKNNLLYDGKDTCNLLLKWWVQKGDFKTSKTETFFK